MVLIAGAPVHAASITYSAPAGGPLPATPLPVSASQVRLAIHDDTGGVHPIAATSASGRFEVAMTVEAGHRYELTGTVAGDAVYAETVVPGSVRMTAPAGDTLTIDALSDSPVWSRYYQIETVGGAAFVLQLVSPDTTISLGTLLSNSGDWQLFLPDVDRTKSWQLRILALDPHAMGWLVSKVPQSNVHRGFGGFGSALPLDRPLVFE
jgi:hypothetical protein